MSNVSELVTTNYLTKRLKELKHKAGSITVNDLKSFGFEPEHKVGVMVLWKQETLDAACTYIIENNIDPMAKYAKPKKQKGSDNGTLEAINAKLDAIIRELGITL